MLPKQLQSGMQYTTSFQLQVVAYYKYVKHHNKHYNGILYDITA